MGSEWTEQQWAELDRGLRARVLAAPTDDAAWLLIAAAARRVMARYTSSFFLVSRFLPQAKRCKVEVIYCAVRYPDEIVDTFPLPSEQRLRRLDAWSDGYEKALRIASLRQAVADGIPPFVAAFAQVVGASGIPPEHYRAFLDAMRHDACPGRFASLADLIDRYIHGSAIVVGYFLTHVYGASSPDRMHEALAAARELGIGLQLTNFLRDVREDHRRGRLYLPLDMLAAAGADPDRLDDAENRQRLNGVIRKLASDTERFYDNAAGLLDAFSPDCRIAIEACINVYWRLNTQIRECDDPLARRQSVPAWVKFRALPLRKYWQLPLYAMGVR